MGRCHGAGIAEEIHLQRRRMRGENRGARIPRVAIEIDHDVDLQLANQFGGGGIRHLARIDEAVRGSFDPRPSLAVVIWPD